MHNYGKTVHLKIQYILVPTFIFQMLYLLSIQWVGEHLFIRSSVIGCFTFISYIQMYKPTHFIFYIDSFLVEFIRKVS